MNRYSRFAVMFGVLVGSLAASAWSLETIVRREAQSVDSFPAYSRREIMPDSGVTPIVLRPTIGNLYAGEWVAFANVNFPDYPTLFITNKSGGWDATMDMYIDGKDDGICIAQAFFFPKTKSFNYFQVDTNRFDPVIKDAVPNMIGKHTVWLNWTKAGATMEGAGNYEYFIWVFPGNKVITPRIAWSHSNSQTAGYSLNGTAGENGFLLAPSQARAGSAFSISGRRVAVPGLFSPNLLIGKGMLITGDK